MLAPPSKKDALLPSGRDEKSLKFKARYLAGGKSSYLSSFPLTTLPPLGASRPVEGLWSQASKYSRHEVSFKSSTSLTLSDSPWFDPALCPWSSSSPPVYSSSPFSRPWPRPWNVTQGTKTFCGGSSVRPLAISSSRTCASRKSVRMQTILVHFRDYV